MDPESTAEYEHPLMKAYKSQLSCGFEKVGDVFDDCMEEALSVLSKDGIDQYLLHAGFLCKMGRGVEPVLIFLEEWPSIAVKIGEAALNEIMDTIKKMWKSPNGKAITPFLQSLPAVSTRLHSREQIRNYLDLVVDFMDRTTGSIHGIHKTFASPGLPEFFQQISILLSHLAFAGLKKWVEYGIVNYNNHPERQKDYFSLKSADSRAVMQRERLGTLLFDNERKLDMYLKGLWRLEDMLVPYSNSFDADKQQLPYYDSLGIRLPDAYDDYNGIAGVDRYRALLAHIVGHKRWTTPVFADNLSPFQRMAVEFFEDSRVDYLVIREFPGHKNILLKLHPQPQQDACDYEKESGVRHRLAMLSRAILDENHSYTNPIINEFAEKFHAIMRQGNSTTEDMVSLAVSFGAKARLQSDQLPNIHFKDTEIGYRDDNRQLWKFIEEGDEEEAFEEERHHQEKEELTGLPPRHYPEWDYSTQTYRPDWVSVYEAVHPRGHSQDIDKLLEKHGALAKRLKRLLDLLKPQDKVRIRYQEEGSELDLDIALKSLIDYKSGSSPDPRINMSHKRNGRNIAVTLLLDLSESLNSKVAGTEQTILELSQEAVSLLAWAVDKLGDPLAIAGFHSNTRHEVRYQHIKGFSEKWDDTVKSRLAAMKAEYSTRMGAAMRHAKHYLEAQKADKKLLLILTDGEPADVDTKDDRLLIEDARRAVTELDAKGIHTHCINLDPKADEYVADIFGKQYTVIDNIQRLPEKLPQLFMALTK